MAANTPRERGGRLTRRLFHHVVRAVGRISPGSRRALPDALCGDAWASPAADCRRRGSPGARHAAAWPGLLPIRTAQLPTCCVPLRLAGPPAWLRRQAAAAAGWRGRLVKSARLLMPQGRRLCLTMRMTARAGSAHPRERTAHDWALRRCLGCLQSAQPPSAADLPAGPRWPAQRRTSRPAASSRRALPAQARRTS